MTSTSITCLNGTFLASDEACLPIADRGFRFGDGVFETIRLESGVPYQWTLHLARLRAGLASLRMAEPAVDWAAAAREVIRRNAPPPPGTLAFLRLSLSRGVGSAGYRPLPDAAPNWAIEYTTAPLPPARPLRLHLSTITRPPASSLPGNAKLAQGIGSTLALMEAADHGCDDAILLTPDGYLAETASANLFWVLNGRLFTPPLSTNCVNGTTRAATLRLFEVVETLATADILNKAEAIFVSNVRVGIAQATLDLDVTPQIAGAHAFQQALTADRAAYAAHHRSAWA